MSKLFPPVPFLLHSLTRVPPDPRRFPSPDSLLPPSPPPLSVLTRTSRLPPLSCPLGKPSTYPLLANLSFCQLHPRRVCRYVPHIYKHFKTFFCQVLLLKDSFRLSLKCDVSARLLPSVETWLLHLANVPKRDCYHPNRRTCAPDGLAKLRCTAITACRCTAVETHSEETQKKSAHRNTASYLEHIFHPQKKRQITACSGTKRNTTKIDLTPESETLG